MQCFMQDIIDVSGRGCKQHLVALLESPKTEPDTKPLIKPRSVLVPHGKHSRHLGSRVHFADPLVESYFLVPAREQTHSFESFAMGQQIPVWSVADHVDQIADLKRAVMGKYAKPAYGDRSGFIGEPH